MKLNLSPIRILLYYLSALMLIGSLSQAVDSPILIFIQVRNYLLLLGGAYGVYRLLLHFKKAAPTRYEHRLITTAILFLLFYFEYPWYVFLGLGMGAELLQRFIRLPTGPLMNPAGLTALIASFLGIYPPWWGASFSPRIFIVPDGVSIAVFLTLPVGLYVAHKYKKLPIVASLMVSFLVSYLIFVRGNPLFILIEGTLIFFALVMAIEPKTSPVMQKEQLIYGTALGFLIPIALMMYFPEPYAGPLVLCNLIFNGYRNRKFLMTKFGPKSAVPVPVQAQPQTQPQPQSGAPATPTSTQAQPQIPTTDSSGTIVS